MSDSIEQIRERFIEQMGIVAQGDGQPRITGRLMGLMVFDGRPYSFSELATELQVSRGSISTNARNLERQGIIERVARPGDRQDYFQLADNPYDAIITGAIARSQKALTVISKTRENLPARGQRSTKGRLGEFEAFYTTIIDVLGEVASRRNI